VTVFKVVIVNLNYIKIKMREVREFFNKFFQLV
jgi:hypothetical protein